MNETEPVTDSVDSLDFTPECEAPREFHEAREADFIAVAHGGCQTLFVCAECLDKMKQYFGAYHSKPIFLTCSECGLSFYSFEEYVSIHPLKG